MNINLNKVEAQLLLTIIEGVEVKSTVKEVRKGLSLTEPLLNIINQLQTIMSDEETKTEETANTDSSAEQASA